ncbi:MAG TPA: hypothetical protein VJC10_00070 [Patescibacteria group bacterium]|nr:hypothetical protein [Patescibacteria group bacterium]
MADFEFIQNPISQKWVIMAPRRSQRPDVAKGSEPVCPFCVGREKDEKEVYRIRKSEIQSTKLETNTNYPNVKSQNFSDLEFRDSNLTNPEYWLVRVLPNKFPFAPIHEVIIHSPDHHKNFDELELSQVELILQTYRQRYTTHKEKGQVYIFHNHGVQGGESLPHPHTQLAVIPNEVKTEIPRFDPTSLHLNISQLHQTAHFIIFCPKNSQWPDEVWIAPKLQGRVFGEINDDQLSDFAMSLQRLVQIFDIRHGNEFPYNFFIYPGGNWYLRLIPRKKTLGGFEVGTGIFVNTQSPLETIAFIKAHFDNPDTEKIRREHQAEYHTGV